jgi:hypothetical protein
MIEIRLAVKPDAYFDAGAQMLLTQIDRAESFALNP